MRNRIFFSSFSTKTYFRTTSVSAFINNIVTDVDSNIRLFPDETSLLIIVENPDMAAKLLNIDFEKNYGMGQTLACNLLSYKNIISSFLKKINQPNHPPLFSLWTIKSSNKSHLISI